MDYFKKMKEEIYKIEHPTTTTIKENNDCCLSPDLVASDDGCFSCRNCATYIGFKHFDYGYITNSCKRKRKPYERYDYVRLILSKMSIIADVSPEEKNRLKNKSISYFTKLKNGIGLYNTCKNKILILKQSEITELRLIFTKSLALKKTLKKNPSIKTIVKEYLKMKGYEHHLFIRSIKNDKIRLEQENVFRSLIV
jgi:hypothetical protein